MSAESKGTDNKLITKKQAQRRGIDALDVVVVLFLLGIIFTIANQGSY